MTPSAGTVQPSRHPELVTVTVRSPHRPVSLAAQGHPPTRRHHLAPPRQAHSVIHRASNPFSTSSSSPSSSSPSPSSPSASRLSPWTLLSWSETSSSSRSRTFPPPLAHPLALHSIRRGDVIVFHYPVDPSIHLVKRVIGVPGDHLRLHENHVYINGQPLEEPYAVYRSGPAENFATTFPASPIQTPTSPQPGGSRCAPSSTAESSPSLRTASSSLATTATTAKTAATGVSFPHPPSSASPC